MTSVYGLSFGDINGMPLAAIRVYLENIPRVLAERRLIAGEGAALPWIKDPKKQIKRWQEAAYGGSTRARAVSPAMLRLMGIGVHYAKQKSTEN